MEQKDIGVSKADFDYAKTRIDSLDWQHFTAAISSFRVASYELQAAWECVSDDGNHPALLVGNYPFADSMEDLLPRIVEWEEAIQVLTDKIKRDDQTDVLLPWNDTKAAAVAIAVHALNPELTASAEYQATVSVSSAKTSVLVVTFGNANDTFGASISHVNGEDMGYIDTGIVDASAATIAALAGAIVKGFELLHKSLETESLEFMELEVQV